MGDEGVAAFVEALKSNAALKTFECVSLSSFSFSLVARCSPVPFPPFLFPLSPTREYAHRLNSNSISDEGACAFAELRKGNVTLKELKCVSSFPSVVLFFLLCVHDTHAVLT
jgi:hypothetical protein